jgi:hypothetical protein
LGLRQSSERDSNRRKLMHWLNIWLAKTGHVEDRRPLRWILRGSPQQDVICRVGLGHAA